MYPPKDPFCYESDYYHVCHLDLRPEGCHIPSHRRPRQPKRLSVSLSNPTNRRFLPTIDGGSFASLSRDTASVHRSSALGCLRTTTVVRVDAPIVTNYAFGSHLPLFRMPSVQRKYSEYSKPPVLYFFLLRFEQQHQRTSSHKPTNGLQNNTSIHISIHLNKETKKQTNERTNERTNEQTSKQTSKQTNKQTNTDKQTNKQTNADKHTNKQTNKQTNTQTNIKTYEQTNRQASKKASKYRSRGKLRTARHDNLLEFRRSPSKENNGEDKSSKCNFVSLESRSRRNFPSHHPPFPSCSPTRYYYSAPHVFCMGYLVDRADTHTRTQARRM